MSRLLLAALILFVALPAAAQEEARDADAQASFDAGVSALRAERYEEATEAFQRSYEAAPRAETACNLALTFDRWAGHKEEAIDAYLRCAQDDESGRYRDFALDRASTLRSQRRPAAAEELPEDADPAPPEPAPDPAPVVAEPDPAPVPVAPEGPPPRSHTLLVVGGITAVVGLALVIGGAVTAGNGRDRVAYLDERYPNGIITDPSDEAVLERADELRTRALVLYVSGGIVAAAGLTLALIDLLSGGDDDRGAQVGLAPLPGGGLASLRLDLR
ncbi:MAG: hypothetical protein CMN30_07605 [Sandaracinus sp.]|nr:hypothetical protein [Sandaracinus sp.]